VIVYLRGHEGRVSVSPRSCEPTSCRTWALTLMTRTSPWDTLLMRATTAPGRPSWPTSASGRRDCSRTIPRNGLSSSAGVSRSRRTFRCLSRRMWATCTTCGQRSSAWAIASASASRIEPRSAPRRVGGGQVMR
jgi:hypothetical protein